jgi:hypothetical protein
MEFVSEVFLWIRRRCIQDSDRSCSGVIQDSMMVVIGCRVGIILMFEHIFNRFVGHAWHLSGCVVDSFAVSRLSVGVVWSVVGICVCAVVVEVDQ